MYVYLENPWNTMKYRLFYALAFPSTQRATHNIFEEMRESLLQPSHSMSASICFSLGQLRRCNFPYSPCRHLCCCAGRATRDTWGKRNAGWAGGMCHRHACRGSSNRGVQRKKCKPLHYTSDWILFSKVRAVPLEIHFSLRSINGTPNLLRVWRKHNIQGIAKTVPSRGSSARHHQRLPCLLQIVLSFVHLEILKRLSRIAEILEFKIPVEVIVIVLLDV